jgi:hypothetical protein
MMLGWINCHGGQSKDDGGRNLPVPCGATSSRGPIMWERPNAYVEGSQAGDQHRLSPRPDAAQPIRMCERLWTLPSRQVWQGERGAPLTFDARTAEVFMHGAARCYAPYRASLPRCSRPSRRGRGDVGASGTGGATADLYRHCSSSSVVPLQVRRTHSSPQFLSKQTTMVSPPRSIHSRFWACPQSLAWLACTSISPPHVAPNIRQLRRREAAWGGSPRPSSSGGPRVADQSDLPSTGALNGLEPQPVTTMCG